MMPSEQKSMVGIQTEKPNHYTYLKEFRVQQCTLFLQHKCTNHRPFTCFKWHFNNQRRRRPVKRRDGNFNYSPDNYCTKYDETTGICPDGDDCPLLHRTAGDTERRYHLRYYKTCMCVHDTDARGFCVKNGPHCAFAHGTHDMRPPVYDYRELMLLEAAAAEEADSSGKMYPNMLDKEKNQVNEDPKWQDTNYVLANYKTEPCKRPPRLCRQGYACPQYHNLRDRRRNPQLYKYRSTPCPSVKQGDDWGDTSLCDAGDDCHYCHARTEQQFHPEIYKSTFCNDVQQNSHCPRSAFCAFAHGDGEMANARNVIDMLNTKPKLADIMSSVLPNSNGCEVSEEEGSLSPEEVALHNFEKPRHNINAIGKEKHALFTPFISSGMNFVSGSSLAPGFEKSDPLLGHFDSLSLKPYNMGKSNDRDLDSPNSIAQGLTSNLLGSSAPVNIPTRSRMELGSLASPSSPNNSFFGDPMGKSKIGSYPSASGNLYSFSPPANPAITRPTSIPPNSMGSMHSKISETNDMKKVQEMASPNRAAIVTWEERIAQARVACEAWKQEAEDSKIKAKMANQQRDDALMQVATMNQELEKMKQDPFLVALNRQSDLKNFPMHVLQSLHARLKRDLDEISRVIGEKCMDIKT
ncbi:RING finger protein unkempt isoform X2 [Neocloeon triangulifer]|uniref:RING finger protein unkempt isoform X2 n=1 Tax=Neocloeon triangulifer TaxID=2078957 RepID=UPI00286FA691|nr:RING finger protein unkempt isoform X2 [Neocloeon triangulifer]